MKDPANAMKDFQQAIEADPTYSLAYFNAANLYFNMRLFEKALKYYDAAVKNCIDDEGAVLNRFVFIFVHVFDKKNQGDKDNFLNNPTAIVKWTRKTITFSWSEYQRE